VHGRSGDDQRPGLDEFAPAGLHDRPRLAGPAANFDTCPGKVEQSLYRPEVADQDQPVIVADARRRVVTEQVAPGPSV
jgi:hypothetical protein